MVKKQTFFLVIFLLNVLVIPNAHSKRLEKIEYEDYYKVLDDRCEITISPKKYRGGEIITNITNLKETNGYKVMIGFDKDIFQGEDVLLYWNKTEIEHFRYQIPLYYYEDNLYNLTYETKDADNFYNGSLILWDEVFNNDTQKNHWVTSTYEFDVLRKSDRVLRKTTYNYVEWKSIKQSFTKHNLYYDGLNIWYISKDFTLIKDKKYTIKILGNLKIQWNKTGEDLKGIFGIAFIPSSLTLGEAITQKKLLYIEPSWYSGSWLYRKEIVFNQNARGSTNEMPIVTIREGTGTDNLNKMIIYINDSRIQEDFDDVRFTKSDGTTLLNIYDWDLDDGNEVNCTIRLESDLSSGDITTYLYYGNPNCSDVFSASNTLVFNEDCNQITGWTKFTGDDTWSSNGSVISCTGGDNTPEKYEIDNWLNGVTSLNEGYHRRYFFNMYSGGASYGTWQNVGQGLLDEGQNSGTDFVGDNHLHESSTRYTLRYSAEENNINFLNLDSGDVDSWWSVDDWLKIETWFDEDNYAYKEVTDITTGGFYAFTNTSVSKDLSLDVHWFYSRRRAFYLEDIILRKWLSDYSLDSIGVEEEAPSIEQGDLSRFFGVGYNSTTAPYIELRWNYNEVTYNHTYYEIERNSTYLNTTTDKFYRDYNVSNGDYWRYRIKSVFNNSGELLNTSWTGYYNYEVVYFNLGSTPTILIPTQINTINDNNYILLVFNIILIGVGVVGIFYPVVSLTGMFIWTFNLLPNFSIDNLGIFSMITLICLIIFTLIGVSRRW